MMRLPKLSEVAGLVGSAATAILTGQLAKLRIRGFKDIQLKQQAGDLYVQYNPAQLALSYASEFKESRFLNEDNSRMQFVTATPGSLHIELTLDAQLPSAKKSVSEQLQELRMICGVIDSNTHQPHFLRIDWGAFEWHGDGYFAGQMVNLAISYELFDSNGVPLRAVARLDLRETRDPQLDEAMRGLNGVGQIVRTSAALPLHALAAGVGTLAPKVDVLALAAENGLDTLMPKAGSPLRWPSKG